MRGQSKHHDSALKRRAKQKQAQRSVGSPFTIFAPWSVNASGVRLEPVRARRPGRDGGHHV